MAHMHKGFLIYFHLPKYMTKAHHILCYIDHQSYKVYRWDHAFDLIQLYKDLATPIVQRADLFHLLTMFSVHTVIQE